MVNVLFVQTLSQHLIHSPNVQSKSVNKIQRRFLETLVPFCQTYIKLFSADLTFSTMGLLSLLPVLSLATVLASPGAQWTEEEALIVKSKLYSLFWNPSWAANWYLERHPELGMTEWPEKKSFPHAPKMLRCIASHDQLLR